MPFHVKQKFSQKWSIFIFVNRGILELIKRTWPSFLEGKMLFWTLFLIMVTVQGAGASGSMTLMHLGCTALQSIRDLVYLQGRKGKKYNAVPCSNIRSLTGTCCSITLIYQPEHQLPLSITSQSSVAIS